MTDKALEKVVSVPAVVLEKTLDTSRHIGDSITGHRHVKKASEYWQTLGPGLTTGAADDDPSGIATYSQTGAAYGFSFLWLALFTFPLMAVIQEMCARIGLVTGRGLAGNIRIHFPKSILYICSILLFIANTFNLGVDLGAMAKATELLFPKVNFAFAIAMFTVIILLLQIFTSYEKYAKYLKFLVLVLLSYVVAAFSIHIDWKNVLQHTVIPSISFSKDQIILVCGILGTTISPYLFFWQTSQEVEEDILKGKTTVRLRQGANDKEVRDMRIDVWSGMFVSNIVMFFIIATCAATLFVHGIRNISTAADAAAALRPIAGENAYLLFALGIIGTGMLAVPVLSTSAAYAVSESFRWRFGLFRKLKEASSFYGVIMISMMIGFAINFLGIDPIKALIYSAVVNGLIAPLILALIVLIGSNRKIMGNRTNNPFTTALGWFVTIAMAITGVLTIIFFFI